MQLTIQANTFLTPLTVSYGDRHCKIWIHAGGKHEKVGRGQVYYFGTNLGASIEVGRRPRHRLVAQYPERGFATGRHGGKGEAKVD